MKNLCVLIFACLLLQACGQAEAPAISTIRDYGIGDDYTATVPAYADSSLEDDRIAIDYSVDEYNVGTIKPIDGAEFEGTARDDAYAASSSQVAAKFKDPWLSNGAEFYLDDGHTAAVTVPAARALKDQWLSNGVEFYLDDGHTAALAMPNPAKMESNSTEISADAYVDDHGWGIQVPESFDWNAILPNDSY
jgi:hypothetical protein